MLERRFRFRLPADIGGRGVSQRKAVAVADEESLVAGAAGETGGTAGKGFERSCVSEHAFPGFLRTVEAPDHVLAGGRCEGERDGSLDEVHRGDACGRVRERAECLTQLPVSSIQLEDIDVALNGPHDDPFRIGPDENLLRGRLEPVSQVGAALQLEAGGPEQAALLGQGVDQGPRAFGGFEQLLISCSDRSG